MNVSSLILIKSKKKKKEPQRQRYQVRNDSEFIPDLFSKNKRKEKRIPMSMTVKSVKQIRSIEIIKDLPKN